MSSSGCARERRDDRIIATSHRFPSAVERDPAPRCFWDESIASYKRQESSFKRSLASCLLRTILAIFNWNIGASKYFCLSRLTCLQTGYSSLSDERLQVPGQNWQLLFRFFSFLSSSSSSDPDTSLDRVVIVEGALFRAALLANCFRGAFALNDGCGWPLPRLGRGGEGSSEERVLTASGNWSQSSSVAVHH